MPEAFRATLAQAKEIDSLAVIERDGKLLGRVTVTLEVPQPAVVLPVGSDLNEPNALVAVDSEGKTCFIPPQHSRQGRPPPDSKDTRTLSA